ncbi:MAG: flippase [Acidimicrobiales bacterium]
MTVDSTQPITPDDAEAASADRLHIRGSSLMLVGRLVSMALNLLVQVVTVRYLSRGGYGSFAFVMAIVGLGSSFVLFGQNKALGRFLPTYEETGHPRKARGSIVVAFSTVFVLGSSLIATVLGLQLVAGIDLVDDEVASQVLVVLIALAPIQALDTLLMELSAVVGQAKTIFIRRYLLTPALRLASVLLVVAVSGGATTLAWAYLGSGLLGLLAYLVMLRNVISRRWRDDVPGVAPPAREMLTFGLPMFTSDMVHALRATIVVVMIGALHTVDDVATYRAVLPVAQLNLIGLQAFGMLYLPVVSRLLARGERAELAGLYWRSTLWISVATFPVFALSFSFARPTTLFFFGDRYQSSATILVVLALGYYLSASFGLNVLTLKGAGRVRALLTIDITVAAINVTAMLLLIPRFGALGGAYATAGSLVLHNVLVQVALRDTTGLAAIPREARRVYAVCVGVALALVGVEVTVEPRIVLALILGAVGSMVVLLANRNVLRVGDTFPEALRIPLIGRLMR